MRTNENVVYLRLMLDQAIIIFDKYFFREIETEVIL